MILIFPIQISNNVANQDVATILTESKFISTSIHAHTCINLLQVYLQAIKNDGKYSKAVCSSFIKDQKTKDPS